MTVASCFAFIVFVGVIFCDTKILKNTQKKGQRGSLKLQNRNSFHYTSLTTAKHASLPICRFFLVISSKSSVMLSTAVSGVGHLCISYHIRQQSCVSGNLPIAMTHQWFHLFKIYNDILSKFKFSQFTSKSDSNLELQITINSYPWLGSLKHFGIFSLHQNDCSLQIEITDPLTFKEYLTLILSNRLESLAVGAAVAHSAGTWVGKQRVPCSRPISTECGMEVGEVPVQGTKPPPALGTLWHLSIHKYMCIACLCMFLGLWV